jgi:superfamily II DNA or RNA helicase
MALTLRPYQVQAIDRVLAQQAEQPILVLPTGAGKTVAAVEIIKRFVDAGKRVLFVAHRRELIAQAAERLRAHGLEQPGIILAGERARMHMPVQVASIQTLGRRQHPPADLVIIDECHHAAGESYRRMLTHYPLTTRLGLTATPFRLDGKPLGDLFGCIVVGAWADDLVAAEMLLEPRFYCAPRGPNLKGVRIVAGDFKSDDLADRMMTKDLVGDIVDNWKRVAEGRRTVVYAVNIAHSKMVVARFQEAGVIAEHLDGETPKEERAAMLERLRNGTTTVLSNCMVLTEGWDLPALEVCVVARPTASLCLHLQMLGRIMRPSTGKDVAIVLDHAGNYYRLGSPMLRPPYSLSQKMVLPDERSTTKRCPDCGLEVALNASVCPGCGHAWTSDEKPVIGGEVPADLVLVVPKPERSRASFSERQDYYAYIENFRQEMGYKPGYTLRRFFARFGTWPTDANGELVDDADPNTVPEDQRRGVYFGMLDTALRKGKKLGWAAYLYQDRFGAMPPWKWRSEWEVRNGEKAAAGDAVPF